MMEDIRYPKQILDYRPIGRRRPWRPSKRLLDRYECVSRSFRTGYFRPKTASSTALCH